MNIESYFPLNIAIFRAVNAAATPDHAVVTLAIGSAQYTPWLVLAVFGVVWFFGKAAVRRATVLAGAALALGLAINFSIAWLIYAPRPSAMGIGHTLLAHAPETSFPSDHATFLWSLGFGLLFSGEIAWLAIGVIALGALTAWARVFLGLHFPLDMAASLVISAASAGAVRAGSPSVLKFLLPPLEWLHGRLRRVANALIDAYKRTANKRTAAK